MGKRTLRQLIAAGYIKARPRRSPPRPDFHTHCKRGHPREAWNVYTYPDGRKECAACRKLYQPVKVPKRWREYGFEGATA